MKQEQEIKKKASSSFNTFRCNLCNTVFSVPQLFNNFCCPYCGSKNIFSFNTFDYSEYKFLPFIDSIGDARRDYQSKVRFNPLLPRSFKHKRTIFAIRKVYIPCVLYNASVDGDISFIGTDKIKNVNTIPKQTFDIKFQTHFDFDNLLVCGLSSIKDDFLQQINEYNFSSLDYLTVDNLRDGYLIPININIDENKSIIDEKIMKMATGIARTNVNHQLKKMNQNNLKLQYRSIEKVMVPVFLNKVKYHGKDYLYLRNGHTGESYIELTTSKLAIVLFSLGLFIIIMFLICFFIFVI